METNKIIAILGRRGRGKSLLAVYYTHSYFKLGKTIYSNIWLSFPYKKITLEMLRDLPECLNDSVILLDEIQVWADAYKFFSKSSMSLSKLVTQLRKRNIILIFTTQFMKQTIVRVRDQVDYIVVMQYYNDNNIKGISHATVLDGIALPPNDFIGEFIFDGRNYFNMYNTNEIVHGD